MFTAAKASTLHDPTLILGRPTTNHTESNIFEYLQPHT